MSNNEAQISHDRTRIAGVFYDNADGSSRQAAIQRCQPLDLVVLRPEPRNPYDSNAIAVDRENGEQLGYLPRPLAKEVKESERRGYWHRAFIHQIFTCEPADEDLEVELILIRGRHGVSDREINEEVRHSIEEQLSAAEASGDLALPVSVGPQKAGHQIALGDSKRFC
jgi:hypothetical protein